MDEHNALKKDLEPQRRIYNVLESFGRLWKEECNRLKKELNASLALVSAEYFQHLPGYSVLSIPNSNTSNASQGRSDSKSKLTGTKRKKESLKNEMLEKELPVQVTRYITSFFDNNTHYAHQEVWESCWVSMHSYIRWKPNETLSENREICDWRGRLTSLGKLQQLRNLDSESLSRAKVPLLIIKENLDHSRGASTYDFLGAYFPFCRFADAQLVIHCFHLQKS